MKNTLKYLKRFLFWPFVLIFTIINAIWLIIQTNIKYFKKGWTKL